MKILITGASGFIGKRLIKELKNQGYNISLLIRKETNTEFFVENNIKYYIFSDDNSILEYFKIHNFDLVIHLATLYLVSNTLNDIDNLIESNIKFGTKLLEISYLSGVKNFINTSSFSQNYENNGYSPVNLYAATKQAFDDIGKYYGESGKINFISISLVNSYGPGDSRKKIFNIWKDSLDNKETIKATLGNQFIDILYVDDIVNAYLKIIKRIEKYGGKKINLKKYSVSSGKIIQLKELADIFEKTVGKKLNIKWGAIPYREREVMYPYNIGEKIPGWKPKTSLKRGIKLFLNLK